MTDGAGEGVPLYIQGEKGVAIRSAGWTASYIRDTMIVVRCCSWAAKLCFAMFDWSWNA